MKPINQHQKQLLNILANSNEPLATKNIRKKLEKLGLYSLEKPILWSQNLERLCSKSLVQKITANDLGANRYRYQITIAGARAQQGINPMANPAAITKKVTPIQQKSTPKQGNSHLEVIKQQLKKHNMTKKTPTEINPEQAKQEELTGFENIQSQKTSSHTITLNIYKDQALGLIISYGLAQHLNLKKGDKIAVLFNPQTQEIAIQPNQTGYTLHGHKSLAIKIAKTPAANITSLMKTPKLNTQAKTLPGLVKAKVA